MAAKPLTTEAIALTEKKMGMTLDEIIKMSKGTASKTKKQRRPSNKNQRILNNSAKEKAFKVRQYMDSRSSVRQGILAQRRSNFQGNQFPLATEAARRAAAAPLHNRAFNTSRVANSNKARVGAPTVPRWVSNGGSAAKPSNKQQQQQQGNAGPKQRPQTLDSLFANMKEQRMRVFSRDNNVAQHNGSGKQRPPWIRARFGK
ncbi:hypothetical protein CFOL_v3_09278 [Cephalotus follicularis]|uniref:Uncharacterized protein n=1 Tax=Cephalotus follicularis TaxID=3775 RepID=A0A1Q3BD49_CEPFO|nr:hypothetical protein CFOL_v3_09278 [Cephalotus follicularis]